MAKPSKASAKTENVAVQKKSLFETVGSFLDTNERRYSSDAESGSYSMFFRIKDASVRVVIDVFETDEWQRLMTCTMYPIYVPEHRRPAAAEALNRINYALLYGNFEMDMADGEIRFRTTMESDHGIPESMIERVLYGNLSSADKHFGALMAIVFGNVEPDGVAALASRPENVALQ